MDSYLFYSRSQTHPETLPDQCAKYVTLLLINGTRQLVLATKTVGRAVMLISYKTVVLAHSAQLISKLTGYLAALTNSGKTLFR